ncbi:hypothetical protein RB601_001018 [Gaeumannomyces tritici]
MPGFQHCRRQTLQSPPSPLPPASPALACHPAFYPDPSIVPPPPTPPPTPPCLHPTPLRRSSDIVSTTATMASPEGDEYECLNTIGRGSFGVIKKVRRKVDGAILCRKEINYGRMSQRERAQLHAEFQILSSLKHPHIIEYYSRCHLKQEQELHLYMEYAGGGDLGTAISTLKAKNQYAEESFVWSIFSQLVTALYRCHYGVNPPEIGNFLGLGNTAKPVVPPGTMTILHRDLKPENVFLGEDNLVKLGDFGLAKMIQSHDFASTYVGTPFYMSPEICAAEKYTLKSDIWSLGCIIYELCAREPPFNAKTHFQLVQKIKEGKIAPLPPAYSPELTAVIKDCLRVNPDRRPDTAALLNLPVVRLMRKEKEVVDMNRLLKQKEDALNARIREYEHKVEGVRKEIDATLHREWEVKARLEIDRVVKDELEKLQKTFEREVQARVEAELQARARKAAVSFAASAETDLSSSHSKSSDYPRSSMGGTSTDGDVSSATDASEVSAHSPDSSFGNEVLVKKNARTPFARAQTMFAGAGAGAVGTPMDVEMASPSPMAIASLSLSPRRAAATKAPPANPGNIFAIPSAIADDPRWAPRDCSSGSSGLDSDFDDDENMAPSPTRMIKSRKNPFKRDVMVSKAGAGGGPGGRPGLMHQKSAPINRLKQQPSLPPAARTATGASADGGALRERSNSPNRRLSKIPSAANLIGAAAGDGHVLSRKPSFTKKDMGGAGLPVLVPKKNNIQGRTLVELQQARAGGRPLSAVMSLENGNGGNVSPTRRGLKDHLIINTTGAAGPPSSRPGSALEPAAVWDPERDDMPSPFLVRRKPIARA